jgi:hypothetical protein
MQFDKDIIDQHCQKYDNSCVSSAVEMILKLLKKVPIEYDELQEKYDNRRDVGFVTFNGYTFQDVIFKHEFGEYIEKRGPNYPLDNLFKRIDEELENNRYICISLVGQRSWHMYVIYEKSLNEYNAFSKSDGKTIYEDHVRRRIAEMGGTDILTYLET